MSDSQTKKTFGDRLFEAMEGVNQKALAKEVGVSTKTIGRYLDRESPPSTAKKKTDHTINEICEQLGVRRAWLMDGEPPMRRAQDDIDRSVERQVSMYQVPEIEMGAGNEMNTEPVNGNLVLPRNYIRREYGVRPNRLVIMRVRGTSMLDTLRPGQKVLAAKHQGDALENGVVYGLRGPLGFSVKRLKFEKIEGEHRIWVWSDNEDDPRFHLSRSEFQGEYDVVAKALEVGQKL